MGMLVNEAWDEELIKSSCKNDKHGTGLLPVRVLCAHKTLYQQGYEDGLAPHVPACSLLFLGPERERSPSIFNALHHHRLHMDLDLHANKRPACSVRQPETTASLLHLMNPMTANLHLTCIYIYMG